MPCLWEDFPNCVFIGSEVVGLDGLGRFACRELRLSHSGCGGGLVSEWRQMRRENIARLGVHYVPVPELFTANVHCGFVRNPVAACLGLMVLHHVGGLVRVRLHPGVDSLLGWFGHIVDIGECLAYLLVGHSRIEHPDCRAYGFGGFLAPVQRAGVRECLVTAPTLEPLVARPLPPLYDILSLTVWAVDFPFVLFFESSH